MKPAAAKIPPYTPPGAASLILPRFPLPGNERASKSSAPSSCGRYGFIISETAYSMPKPTWPFCRPWPDAIGGKARFSLHDNASYHKKPLVQTWLDANGDWLGVQPLPKYSPQLNPTERLWQYTR